MHPSVELVWFDSMGAKSSAVLVKCSKTNVLIDAGVAIMHRGFPAPVEAKRRWLAEGKETLLKASREAHVVTITHYHYDHFTDFDERIYRGKIVLAKSPNDYINDSQRSRAERFYKRMINSLGLKVEVVGEPSGLSPDDYNDPLDELKDSRLLSTSSKDVKERLEAGRKWFKERARRWSKLPRLNEIKASSVNVMWADGREFEFRGTKIKFSKPLFHGEEYSRVGWVLYVVVKESNWCLLHTSDLDGPVIEDYAYMIIKEKPNVLIVDGPPTYLLGYRLSYESLDRAINNMESILTEAQNRLELVIYDHHLTREPEFRKRTARVWDIAKKLGVRISTAAELLGLPPAVIRYSSGARGKAR